jgi:hypothetical protein
LLLDLNIRDFKGNQCLYQRPAENKYENYSDGIKIYNPPQHDDSDDKSDGSPSPDSAVTFLFFAQYVHGKGFEKRNDGRVKYAIKKGDKKHEPKVSGVEVKTPYCDTDKIT